VIFTYGKYIFLIVLVVLIPLLTGEPWFCKLCPQGTLQAGIPQVLLRNELKTLIGRLYWVKIMILIFFVIGFVFIPRLFCRTICPVGGFLAIFNRISFLQIKVDSNKCNRCDKCREVCPVDISIYEDSSSPECVRCLACTFCPAVRAGSFIENAAIRTSPQ
ncbi:MAG: 4Fe-4S binding protein, partial [bacterium]